MVPLPHERITSNNLPNAVASLAIRTSQPIHRDDVPGLRAENDRVPGPGVDREMQLWRE